MLFKLDEYCAVSYARLQLSYLWFFFCLLPEIAAIDSWPEPATPTVHPHAPQPAAAASADDTLAIYFDCDAFVVSELATVCPFRLSRLRLAPAARFA